MASFTNALPSFVKRNPGATALATITLVGLGVIFNLTGNTPTGPKAGGAGTTLQQWGGSGGVLTGKLYASGSLVLSGTTVVGHRATGSGRLMIQGADGGKVCQADSDGTGCTCNSCNNGVCSTWIGTTAECSPPDTL